MSLYYKCSASGRYAVGGYEYFAAYEYIPRPTEKVADMKSCSSGMVAADNSNPRLDTAGKCADYCISKQGSPDDKFFGWGKQNSNPVCQCYGGDACGTDSGRYAVGGYEYYGIYKYSDMTVRANGYGDPHFTKWDGSVYDFHGGCDLVLVQNDNFEHGLGLRLHVRTEINTWWSYIKTAAVRVGDRTLEITGGKNKIGYHLDGQKVEDMETGDATLGDYAIHFRRIDQQASQTRISLGGLDAISIETFKKFVRVNISVKDQSKFHGTYGMMGAFPDGSMIGRDKTTKFEDHNEFGMEWQVRSTDPQLFHTAGPIQPPMKCAMPDLTKKSEARRRLGEAAISEEDAALACDHVSMDDKDACIFDVLATNDKDMAGSY